MTKLQFRGLKLLHQLQETSVLHIQVFGLKGPGGSRPSDLDLFEVNYCVYIGMYSTKTYTFFPRYLKMLSFFLPLSPLPLSPLLSEVLE